MDEIFEKNLISTKDAGELSGYSSDYLARLARSGKIDGKRIGHSWFLDKESLTSFLDQQEIARLITRARSRARAKRNIANSIHFGAMQQKHCQSLLKSRSRPLSRIRCIRARSLFLSRSSLWHPAHWMARAAACLDGKSDDRNRLKPLPDLVRPSEIFHRILHQKLARHPQTCVPFRPGCAQHARSPFAALAAERICCV